jgi:hypothetical protein
VVGGVGHQVDGPLGKRAGQQPDQGAGQLDRGGGLAAPQPKQHRQAGRPAAKRQRDDDPDDHPVVPAGSHLPGLGGVVGPERAVDACAAAAKQAVVDGQVQVGPRRHQGRDDQPGHRQAQLVGRPGVGGEEPVGPVVADHGLHPGTGQHAGDGAQPGLGDRPDRQQAEHLKRPQPETGSEPLQQHDQRARYRQPRKHQRIPLTQGRKVTALMLPHPTPPARNPIPCRSCECPACRRWSGGPVGRMTPAWTAKT